MKIKMKLKMKVKMGVTEGSRKKLNDVEKYVFVGVVRGPLGYDLA